MDRSITPQQLADDMQVPKEWRERFMRNVKMLRDGPLYLAPEEEATSKLLPILSNNAKAGASTDFLVASCHPTANCVDCYAASSMVRQNVIQKAYRSTIHILVDPKGWAQQVADEAASVPRSEMPFIRMLGSGDLTTTEMLRGFNELAKVADRPIHVFSRHHDMLSKLKDGPDAPFIRMGSLDQQLYKTYGLPALKANFKKHKIANCWMMGSVEELPLMRRLMKAGALKLVLVTDEKLYSSLDPDMKISACPCDAGQNTFVRSCSECALAQTGCFMAFSELAIDSKGKWWEIADPKLPSDAKFPTSWFSTGEGSATEAHQHNAEGIIKAGITQLKNRIFSYASNLLGDKRYEAMRKKDKAERQKSKAVLGKAMVRAIQAQEKKLGDEQKSTLTLKDVRWPGDKTEVTNIREGLQNLGMLERILEQATGGSYYLPGGEIRPPIAYEKGKRVTKPKRLKQLEKLARAGDTSYQLKPGQRGVDAFKEFLKEREAKKKAAETPPPKPKAPEAKPGRSDYTGIKRERVEMQADALGIPRPSETETVRALEIVGDAVAHLTSDSDKDIVALAAEVIATQKPITVEETADLLASVDYHKRMADEAIDHYNDFLEAGEAEKAETAKEDADRHKADLRTVHQAARDVGRRQFAYMGHVLQVLVDPDGEAYIERILRQANNGVLPESGEAFAKKMADDLEAAKKKQAKRGKEIDESEALATANEKIAELEGELKRERTRSRKSRGSRNKIVTEKAKDDAVTRIHAKIKSFMPGGGKLSMNPADVASLLPDAAIVAGYHIEAGAIKLADFSRAMVADLGDWVRPHLADLHSTVRAEYAVRQQEALRERLADADDVRGQHRSVAALAKEILAETRKDDGTFIHREKLLDLLHKELQKIDEGITRREAMDLFSGYGKYQELSKDDLEVAYRDRRGEARELGKIGDMQKKMPPSSTGREMHTPSDEERQYHRDVRDLKKQGEREGWYYSGDRGKRLRGTLEAQKTRLRNEVRDLDSQIEAGKKTVKGKTVPLTDPELDALRQLRDQRKERLDAVVRAAEDADLARFESEGGAVVDPALEEYLKVLDRQIESLKRQLVKKDVFPKSAGVRPFGQVVDIRKAIIEDLQAEKAQLRKQLDPDYEANQRLLNAEKAAEREVAKLEKERSEGFKMREEPEPLPESDRLNTARAKLDAIRQEKKKALENEYLLRAAIAQSKRNAANIAERIASGDFAPRTRKPARTWDDPVWQDAKLEELAKRKELAEKIAEYEWQNMDGWQTTGFFAKRISVLWKAIMTGFDLTAQGLQLGIANITNPIIWSKALIPTFKAISVKQRKLQDAEMQADPDWERYKGYGVALSEHGESKDVASTEFYGNDAWLEKIPGAAVSERTFSTALNHVRFNLMRVQEWAYTKDGRKLSQQQGEAIARYVNTFTLAYKPPKNARKRQAVLQAAGIGFWAPSMYVARAQLLAGAPVLLNKGADSRVRLMAAKQYVKAIVGVAALTAALRMLLGDDEEREFLPTDDEDVLNPTDPDYYKVKVGNKRMDMTSGMGQMFTYAARLLNSASAARAGGPVWETKGRPMGARRAIRVVF